MLGKVCQRDAEITKRRLKSDIFEIDFHILFFMLIMLSSHSVKVKYKLTTVKLFNLIPLYGKMQITFDHNNNSWLVAV